MDQQRLRELLDYDAETGVFTWRESRGGSNTGQVAGCPHPKGYIRICIDGRRYAAHRLAWLYVVGALPSGEIDHINGERNDNRIANLRDVSTQINQQNQRRARTNNRSSGLLGVTRKRGRWQAQIETNGKNVFLGCYSTKEDAHSAYLKAKRQRHDGCTI